MTAAWAAAPEPGGVPSDLVATAPCQMAAAVVATAVAVAARTTAAALAGVDRAASAGLATREQCCP